VCTETIWALLYALLATYLGICLVYAPKRIGQGWRIVDGKDNNDAYLASRIGDASGRRRHGPGAYYGVNRGY
jgi:hypothetical protein